MDTSIRALSHQTSNAVETSAAESVFWELPCDETNTPTVSMDPQFDKQLWIQRVLMEWGICGYTAYVGMGECGTKLVPAASVFFAPANYFPGAQALPTAPVSPDAILISNVFVATPFMGLYLEHQLIDTVLTEARRRGIKAVEAFARLENEDDGIDGPWELLDAPNGDNRFGGLSGGVEQAEGDHYLPEAYKGWQERHQSHTGDLKTDLLSIAPILTEDILEAQGFQVVADHPQYPRYRYEVQPGNSLFSAYAEDDHTKVNEAKPLPTVLGGKKKAQPVGVAKAMQHTTRRTMKLGDAAGKRNPFTPRPTKG